MFKFSSNCILIVDKNKINNDKNNHKKFRKIILISEVRNSYWKWWLRLVTNDFLSIFYIWKIKCLSKTKSINYFKISDWKMCCAIFDLKNSTKSNPQTWFFSNHSGILSNWKTFNIEAPVQRDYQAIIESLQTSFKCFLFIVFRCRIEEYLASISSKIFPRLKWFCL